MCIFSHYFLYLLFSCSTTVCFEFGFPMFLLCFQRSFSFFCVSLITLVGFVLQLDLSSSYLCCCCFPFPLSVCCTHKLHLVTSVVAIQKGLGELLNSYQSSRLILVRLMILIGCQICGLCFPPHSRHETPIQWQARRGG